MNIMCHMIDPRQVCALRERRDLSLVLDHRQEIVDLLGYVLIGVISVDIGLVGAPRAAVLLDAYTLPKPKGTDIDDFVEFVYRRQIENIRAEQRT